MSNCFNTDGLFTFPPDNTPITVNALESIECTIAFDVHDWGSDRRSAWIYAIVFGIADDEMWEGLHARFSWDDADRKRAEDMHNQWIKAKNLLQTEAEERENDCT